MSGSCCVGVASGGGCGLCWGHDVFHSVVNEVSNVPILTAQGCSIINTRRLQSTKYSTCTRKTQNTCIMVGNYTVSYIHDIICITQ